MQNCTYSEGFTNLRVLALAGGVGGAKLAQGLAHTLSPEQLRIVVNTGDDFTHWGLNISPDLDTVMYTLAGMYNQTQGWGLQDESFNCLAQMGRYGNETWFNLGDRDLATHLLRTRWMHEGMRLTEVTARLCRQLGVEHQLLPMSDDLCQTVVITEEGELAFQEYFVKRHWQPVITGLRWHEPAPAQPTSQFMQALQWANVVILCPSNPFVSIEPILRLPGVRPALNKRKVVAVSPILGGKAVKGPAAKIFSEFGIEPSALAVAEHYQDILTGFVADAVDAALLTAIQKLGIHVAVMPTLMTDLASRACVACGVLSFAESL